MPKTDNAIQQILKTAVLREIDAFTLYSNAAESVAAAPAKLVLQDLAAQEVGHRRRLEALLQGRVFRVLSKTQEKKVVDLKITDYLVEEPLGSDADLQNVLIVAGKRENSSHDLYRSLAQVAEDEDSQKLFAFLADEEMMHKNRVETLYEELILRDN